MKKMNKKGFTMAELLIVVAIIAVLVAIAIPIFTTQLEKSREATDAANIRAAYAEILAKAVGDEDVSDLSAFDYTLKQKEEGWTSTGIDMPDNLVAGTTAVDKNVTVTFTYDSTNEQVKCNIVLP